MKKHFLTQKSVYLFSLLFLFACAQKTETAQQETEKPEVTFEIDAVFDFAASQYSKALVTLADSTKMPYSGNADGTWVMCKPKNWMAGFFAGSLWYLYEYTGNEKWEIAAREWTEKMEEQQYMDQHHDIGFMMFSTYGNGFRLTGDTTYLPIIYQSAKTALNRYNPTVGTIKSWNKNPGDHPTIIDNMMNLELLVWAAQQFDDPELYQVAVKHSDVTMENHFRDDFSTFHVVLYDSASGNVVKQHTAQGYSDDSRWSRGQAWGIYGYTMMYRYTKDRRYLERAMKNADNFIGALPEDGVPYWDFDAPGIPDTYRDASAGAIASSAFLELSTHLEDPEKAGKYYQAAVNTLNSLSTDAYLAKGENYGCVLLHSAYSVPGDHMPDVNKTYADYYYLEALIRLDRLMKGEAVFQSEDQLSM